MYKTVKQRFSGNFTRSCNLAWTNKLTRTICTSLVNQIDGFTDLKILAARPCTRGFAKMNNRNRFQFSPKNRVDLFSGRR